MTWSLNRAIASAAYGSSQQLKWLKKFFPVGNNVGAGSPEPGLNQSAWVQRRQKVLAEFWYRMFAEEQSASITKPPPPVVVVVEPSSTFGLRGILQSMLCIIAMIFVITTVSVIVAISCEIYDLETTFARRLQEDFAEEIMEAETYEVVGGGGRRCCCKDQITLLGEVTENEVKDGQGVEGEVVVVEAEEQSVRRRGWWMFRKNM